MVEHHDLFELPPESAWLWRYTSISKTVAMLERRSLFFSRTDRLGAYDRFEGTLPAQTYRAMDAASQDEIKALRAHRLVNCWHAREHESDGLWRSYIPTGDGIAIRSSVERFRAAFADVPQPVYIGSVKYIDFDRTRLPDEALKFAYLYKRLSFEHEYEVRAVIGTEATVNFGIDVAVNLDALVETIHIPPTAPDWFGPMVALLFERYGFPRVVQKSSLAREPYL